MTDARPEEPRRFCFEQRAISPVNWEAVHTTTRLLPTVTTFGWRIKALFSAPPLIALGWWTATGAFFNGAIALGLGAPMLAASIWWFRQVWTPGPASPTALRPPGTASTAPPPAPPMHPAMAYLYESEPGPRSADPHN